MTIASLTYRHSIGVPHWNDVPNWNARVAAHRDLWRFHAALAWHALCPDAWVDRLEDLLPAPLVLTFVSTGRSALMLERGWRCAPQLALVRLGAVATVCLGTPPTIAPPPSGPSAGVAPSTIVCTTPAA